MGLFSGFDGSHVTLELLSALLGAVSLRLVGLGQEKLTLAIGCFVEIDKCDQYGEPEANQPAFTRPSCHLFQLEAREEFNLDEHG